MPDQKKVKAKISSKSGKRSSSDSSNITEIDSFSWSEEDDSPKKVISSRNLKNQVKSDASLKANSKAEDEDLKSKRVATSQAKKPKKESILPKKRAQPDESDKDENEEEEEI